MSILVIAIALVVAYVAITQFDIRRRKAKFPATQPHQASLNDNFFGFKNTKESLASLRAGELPRLSQRRFAKAKANTFSLYVAGRKIVATKDPENIKAVLATQFNDFSLGLRHDQFFPLLGDGIFTLDHAGWKHSRAMLRPQFAREQVAHVKMLEPHIQALIKNICDTKGMVFDLQELFFRLTIDSATEFLFGESINSLSDTSSSEVPYVDEFAEVFNRSQLALAVRSSMQKLYWFSNSTQFREDNEKVHKFTDFYVLRALAKTHQELEEQNAYTFLYELAKQTRDPKVLRDQSLNILLAGRDTTAGLLSFLFYELGSHPEVLSRLREEIVTKFGEGENVQLEEITFESLKKCEYLKAVVNETLRLWPSVPMNGRFVERDTTLPRGGGPNGDSPVFVPKGSTVSYSVFSMHRDVEIYGKDAEEFNPDRWLDESRVSKLGWGFLPFNGGPRICLGQQFALTEAYYTTVRLLQTFPFLVGHDGEARLNTHLTMSLLDGCNVVMT